jgi:hypothetical protein
MSTMTTRSSGRVVPAHRIVWSYTESSRRTANSGRATAMVATISAGTKPQMRMKRRPGIVIT